MPETIPPAAPVNGGKAVIASLAGSSSQIVQIIIALGMVTNVVLTKQTSSTTDKNVDKLRQQVADEVHQILNGQKATKVKLGAIMDKLGVTAPLDEE